MPRVEIRNGARLAAALGLGLTLSLGAAPVVALAEPAAETQGSTNEREGVVNISSVEQLKSAIENQQDGQTWVLAPGIYTLTEPFNATINGHNDADFAFPITVDNLTIKGDGTGDVLITSSWTPNKDNGGVWNYQNFVTVTGQNVTIEGVDLQGNPNGYYDGQCNKVIELVEGAKDFTLRDVDLKPLTDADGKGCSGSIYVNVSDPGTTTIENVTMSSWINARAVTGGSVTVKNVTQDFTNNTYAGYSDSTYGYAWNPGVSVESTGADHVTVDGLKIVVDNDIEFEQQLLNGQFKSGTTVVLAEDITLENPLNIKNIKGLTIDGGGHAITAADSFAPDENGKVNLVKPENSEDITFQNLKLVAGAENQHVLDVWGCKDVTLLNVTLDHSGSEYASGGAPLIVNGSDVSVTGPLTIITGEKSWYAVNVDAKNGAASFDVTEDASSSFVLAGNDEKNGIVVENTGGSGNNNTASASIGSNGVASSSDQTTLTQSVAKIGDTTYSSLQAAVTAAAAQQDATIELVADAFLTKPVEVPAGAAITIDGNGRTVSFDGKNGARTAFNNTTSGQTEGIAAGTNLTVSDVTFENTGEAGFGYAVIVGGNSFGTSVDLSGCTFENLYCAVYGNPVTTQVSGTKPSVGISGSTYVNTTYGYALDTVSPGANANGYDAPVFTDNELGSASESEVIASALCTVVDENGTVKSQHVSLKDAVAAAAEGQEIRLNGDVETTEQIPVSISGVTINGNGHTVTYTGAMTGGSFAFNGGLFDVTADGVQIGDMVIDTKGNTKFGVQFYCAEGGKLTGVTIKGGAYACANVNGSEVSVSNSTLEPSDAAYAHIDFSMGSSVTEVPELTIGDNVTFAGDQPRVRVDEDTMRSYAKANGMDADNLDKSAILDAFNKNLRGIQLEVNDQGDFVDETPSTPVTPPAQTGEPVRVEQPEGAEVSVSPSRADEGDVVTVTVAPDEGREVVSVTVTDGDGSAVEVTPGEKGGTWTFEMPAGPVTVTAETRCDGGELCPSRGLADVVVGEWYHDAVDWAVETGLMTGYGHAAAFGPSDPLSRAQLAQVLWNRAGRPDADASAVGAFPDCDADAFYAEAVAWCAETGIMTGYEDGTFGPADDMTREQLATVLWRAAGSPEADADLSAFPDAGSVSEFASEAMCWAVENSAISGQGSDGTLDPVGSLERAQCATVFYRLDG